MKKAILFLCVLMLAGSLVAQKRPKAPKQELTDDILNAKYVAVVIYNDKGFVRNDPEDLKARARVEQALRSGVATPLR